MHHRQPGWAENDPEDWSLGLVRTGSAAMPASAVDPARVAGLAVVCQREPVVLTDAAGAVMAPVISWTDQPAPAEAGEIGARLRRGRLFVTPGRTPFPGMGPAPLLWFQRPRPGPLRSGRRVP